MDNYRMIKLLGEGAFGKAYLVEAQDGTKCVIKQMDISKMSETEKREALKEAKILEALNHPNIVRFRDVYKTKKSKLCIVMDYADGGDLQAAVNNQRGRHFDEKQILDWFVQWCLALKHVHDRKVIHRDIKTQNVFLTRSKMIKFGDFGIAKVLQNTRENARTMVGTPYYLSPEIVGNKPYSFKSDVWSLGVMLYELCALKPPFDAPSLNGLAMKISRGAYAPPPAIFSRDLKGLISQLLQVNPAQRPTIGAVLKMPFIQNRIQNFLTDSVRLNEFSHTVLHRQNVFDAAKNNPAQQPAKPAINAPRPNQPGPPQSRPNQAPGAHRAQSPAAQRGQSPADRDYARIVADAAAQADKMRAEGELRRKANEQRQAEAAKQKAEEARRKYQREQDEKRRLDQIRREAEQKRHAEQRRRDEDRARQEKARKEKMEQERREQEAKRQANLRKYEEDRKRAIAKAKEEQKRKEEARQKEEKRKFDELAQIARDNAQAAARRREEMERQKEKERQEDLARDREWERQRQEDRRREDEEQKRVEDSKKRADELGRIAEQNRQAEIKRIRDARERKDNERLVEKTAMEDMVKQIEEDRRRDEQQRKVRRAEEDRIAEINRQMEKKAMNEPNFFVPKTPGESEAPPQPPKTAYERPPDPKPPRPETADDDRRPLPELLQIKVDNKKKGKKKKKKGKAPGTPQNYERPPIFNRAQSVDTDPPNVPVEIVEKRNTPSRRRGSEDRDAARNDFLAQMKADKKKKKSKKSNVNFELVGNFPGMELEESKPKGVQFELVGDFPSALVDRAEPRAPVEREETRQRTPDPPCMPAPDYHHKVQSPQDSPPKHAHAYPEETKNPYESSFFDTKDQMLARLAKMNDEILLNELENRSAMIDQMEAALDVEEEDQQIEIVVECDSDEERDDPSFEEISQSTEDTSADAPDPPGRAIDPEFSGFSKLEALKIYLEEKLGTDVFVEAYQVVKKQDEIDCTDQDQIKQYFRDHLKHVMTDES